MNPMELMQFSRDLDDFQANHPKVAKFLQIEFGKVYRKEPFWN